MLATLVTRRTVTSRRSGCFEEPGEAPRAGRPLLHMMAQPDRIDGEQTGLDSRKEKRDRAKARMAKPDHGASSAPLLIFRSAVFGQAGGFLEQHFFDAFPRGAADGDRESRQLEPVCPEGGR